MFNSSPGWQSSTSAILGDGVGLSWVAPPHPVPVLGRVHSLKRRHNVNMINVFPGAVWHVCGHHHHIGGAWRQYWHWHTIMPIGGGHRDDLLPILQSLDGWDGKVPHLLAVVFCGENSIITVSPLGKTLTMIFQLTKNFLNNRNGHWINTNNATFFFFLTG